MTNQNALQTHAAEPMPAPPAAPSFDIDAFFENQKTHTERLKRAIDTNKATLFPALKAAGITLIEVSYDGCGDSGQIETIRLTPPCESEEPFPPMELPIIVTGYYTEQDITQIQDARQAIESISYDILQAAQAGWEINEGSFGNFVFDIENDEINLDHSERIEETRDSAHCF